MQAFDKLFEQMNIETNLDFHLGYNSSPTPRCRTQRISYDTQLVADL